MCLPAFKEPLADLISQGIAHVLTLHFPQVLCDSLNTLQVVVVVLCLFNSCGVFNSQGSGLHGLESQVFWMHGLIIRIRILFSITLLVPKYNLIIWTELQPKEASLALVEMNVCAAINLLQFASLKKVC